MPSCRLYHAPDGSHYAFEFAQLAAELFSAFGGQCVIAGAPVIFRLAPLGNGPTFDQHALQRGIERSLFHLQNFVGGLLDVIGDSVAVHGPETREGFENQHI